MTKAEVFITVKIERTQNPGVAVSYFFDFSSMITDWRLLIPGQASLLSSVL
jgi:hypothetical protein